MGEVLLAEGIITAQELSEALELQREPEHRDQRLGQVLALLGYASEMQVAQSLAEHLGLEHVDLSRVIAAPEVVRLLPQHIVERTGAIALDRHPNGALIVASCDPTNVLALDDVRLYARCNEIMVVVATATQIREQVARAWSLSGDAAEVSLIDKVVEDAAPVREDPAALGSSSVSDEDAPVVRLVNQVLADATRLRASDIHLEPQRDGLRIRYRIDGLLRDVMTAPKRVAPSVVSRIKIMAGLDIAERRVPQDGRTRIKVDDHELDTRVSTLPALHGEKVVIRILTRPDGVAPLDGLGLEPAQLDAFRRALQVPQGLVLITGPTGSGKTSTLYSAINEAMSPEKNVVTLEDPVEVQLPGITQVQVNPKAGLTFESGLRSVLRQDPDVVLVGEVRDPQTAELALKAALTGHLVLTTLHTSSAVAALTRLVDMGVAPFLVASSLTAVVAQRLVRVPCATCAEPYVPSDGDPRPARPGGHRPRRGHPGARHRLPRLRGHRLPRPHRRLRGARGRRPDALDPAGHAHRARRRRARPRRRSGHAAHLGAGEGLARRDHVRGGRARHALGPPGRAGVPVVRPRRGPGHAHLPLVRLPARTRWLRHLPPADGAGLEGLPLVPAGLTL